MEIIEYNNKYNKSSLCLIPFYRVKEEVYKAWEEAESEVFFNDSIGKGKKTQREQMDKIMRYTGLDRKVVEDLVK